jgi:hypothetical protein
MFRVLMRVARRQRRYASRHNDLRAAHAQGQARLRRWYSSLALEQIDAALAAHDWRSAIRAIATLMRQHPKGLASLVRHNYRLSRLRRLDLKGTR